MEEVRAVFENKSVWDDDDEIHENKNIMGTVSQEELLKLLKIEVKASQKMIKLKSKETQVIPAMVSIRSDERKKEGMTK